VTSRESDLAPRGRILVDWEIREYVQKYRMIDPFEDHLVREGAISYGLSSMGYDLRIAHEFKIFTNINTTVVDPKRFDPRSFVDVTGESCIIPPNSFALGRSLEYFRIPSNRVGAVHRKIDLRALRHRRQHDPSRVRMGGTSDDRNLQYHAVAGENL
jgi:hypothetical protein